MANCCISMKVRKPAQGLASALYRVLEGSTRFHDRSIVRFEVFYGM